MKKYIYQFIILSGVALAAGSCSKAKLNPVSSTSIPSDVVFRTKERIANQVNGLYAQLKSGKLLGGRWLIYNDVRGDNFINETGNGVTALTMWNFSVTGSDAEINNCWNAGYNCINQCNLFLDGMAAGGDTVIKDAALVAQYHGEAKFVRALAYFSLLQLYAQPYAKDNGASPGLPLRLKGITQPGSNDLARSSVSNVYKQILSDLNDAEAAVPANYGDPNLNVIHAHKNAVIALKERVYLHMGDWDNVITEGNKIVPASAPFKSPTGVPNALAADVRDVFTKYTTSESVLSMPFTGANEAPGTQNQLGAYYLPAKEFTSQGSGEYSLNTVGIVADAGWKSTDARRSFVFTNSKGKPWLTKYAGGSPYVNWVPIIRYSDVLLMLAEARTRKTNSVDAQAVELLNAVRHRSDPSTTFAPVSAADLLDAILNERNIEFLGEGLRGIDITRLLQTFPTKKGGTTAPAVDPSAAAYIFPAPTSETLYNHDW